MGGLSATVERDFATGVTDVRLTGHLDLAGAVTVRQSVAKGVADGPLAVVIDLNGVTATVDAALTVFLAQQRRQAAQDHPVPLLIHVAPDDAAAVAARRVLGTALEVHPDRAAALTGLAGGPVDRSRVHLHLPAAPGSAAAARAFVAKACDRWRLTHLVDSAQVIVGELVSNAVRHAGTEIAVTVSRGRVHLIMTVRDRSRRTPAAASAPPAPRTARGRGLVLVDKLAAGWGTVLHGDGKAVWANLRTNPLAKRFPLFDPT